MATAAPSRIHGINRRTGYTVMSGNVISLGKGVSTYYPAARRVLTFSLGSRMVVNPGGSPIATPERVFRGNN